MRTVSILLLLVELTLLFIFATSNCGDPLTILSRCGCAHYNGIYVNSLQTIAYGTCSSLSTNSSATNSVIKVTFSTNKCEYYHLSPTDDYDWILHDISVNSKETYAYITTSYGVVRLSLTSNTSIVVANVSGEPGGIWVNRNESNAYMTVVNCSSADDYPGLICPGSLLRVSLTTGAITRIDQSGYDVSQIAFRDVWIDDSENVAFVASEVGILKIMLSTGVRTLLPCTQEEYSPRYVWTNFMGSLVYYSGSMNSWDNRIFRRSADPTDLHCYYWEFPFSNSGNNPMPFTVSESETVAYFASDASLLVKSTLGSCPIAFFGKSNSSLNHSSVSNSTCQPCPAGFFGDPLAICALFCESCQPGSYNDLLNSTACSTCNPGFYSSTESATMCSSCPRGTVSDDNCSSCTHCPMGALLASIDCATNTGIIAGLSGACVLFLFCLLGILAYSKIKDSSSEKDPNEPCRRCGGEGYLEYVDVGHLQSGGIRKVECPLCNAN